MYNSLVGRLAVYSREQGREAYLGAGGRSHIPLCGEQGTSYGIQQGTTHLPRVHLQHSSPRYCTSKEPREALFASLCLS